MAVVLKGGHASGEREGCGGEGSGGGTRREGEGEGEVLKAVGIRMSQQEADEGRRMLHRLEELSRVPVADRPLLPRRLRALTLHQDTTLTAPPQPHAPKPTRRNPSIHPPQLRSSKWHNPKIVIPRLLRRRYAHLLHDAPVVTVTAANEAAGPARIGVVRSGWAKGGMERFSELGAEGEWWLSTFGAVEGKKKKGKGAGRAAQGAEAGGASEGAKLSEAVVEKAV